MGQKSLKRTKKVEKVDENVKKLVNMLENTNGDW
jgi:hypothetical protein